MEHGTEDRATLDRIREMKELVATNPWVVGATAEASGILGGLEQGARAVLPDAVEKRILGPTVSQLPPERRAIAERYKALGEILGAQVPRMIAQGRVFSREVERLNAAIGNNWWQYPDRVRAALDEYEKTIGGNIPARIDPVSFRCAYPSYIGQCFDVQPKCQNRYA